MQTSQQIVIVTEPMDMHTDILIRTLREMNHEPIRFHTEDIPLQTTLTMLFDREHWDGTLRAGKHTIDFGAVGSIWWRRPGFYKIPRDMPRQEYEFARLELEHAFSGLWASLDCYWMSFPANIRQASWKPEQLKRAAALGFDVPRTIITTDPEQARAFYDTRQGPVVYKPLSDPTLAARIAIEDGESRDRPQLTYTTLLEDSHLSLLESIRLAPCLFQEYIDKQLELRVTVIGDDIFPVEIHSQQNERTRIDWRHYDVDIPYRKGDLPLEIAERCHALVKSYGLHFSAIDLILTPDGRYVFLESNPNGQFLFLEERVPELKMAEAVANCLIRGKAGI